ncbi:CBS domain-containing protein [Romboutsia weinsteinii]|uniref:CBS domain-containing protein n=1 Tax=Romboutsia weinsteinii TaxID=2020949 RepID=A0A371IXS7_9FIRM|nr:sigma-54 dependent transcriptional regulator PrdR [Romboutsia weinsteinii]RDY25274.1 CBS domain-containing protein [Romboutsia weinsteinii]
MFSIPELKMVEEVMDEKFTCINKDTNLNIAIQEMIKANVRALVVINNKEKIEGIISMTDIHKISNQNDNYKNVIVADVMSRDIIYASKGIDINQCRNMMIKNKIGILPILDDGKVVGVLNQNHIRDYLYMELEDYGITVKHIVGEIKEGICAINAEGIVILWNKFMEERYGILSSKIVGRPIHEFLRHTISERVLNSKESMSDVYCSCDKEDLYGLVHANPIYIEGEFLGVVCTEVDITEAKKLSIELEKANDTLKYLQDEVKNLSKGSFDKVLGKSYKLEKEKEVAKRVSKTNSSILIFGESGTGKEVFARAIHEYSDKVGQFIPVNCSAIPNELFESEFFGYESGAFTGASKKGKMGIFELAKNGTVFLDEIGDLPMNMQAKLLRVLQEKEVRRIGGEKIIKIKSRVICATNKNLSDLVKEGKFREDLYYRLNVVEINLPPLRERKEDIEILIHNFLKEICEENEKSVIGITKESVNILQSYKWKGNIRELKNTIENLVVLSKRDVIEVEDLPSYITESSYINEDDDGDLDLVKLTQKLENRVISKALELTKGNKAKAAKILNIPRTTLYYKIDQNDIEYSKT